MHLVACPTPQEPLEVAPMSALPFEQREGDRWESFWSSDAYLVRCTRDTGAVEWFMVADDAPAQDAATATERVVSRRFRSLEPRVIEFPLRRMQTSVIVAKGPDGRGMLVGTARRVSSRASVRRTGE